MNYASRRRELMQRMEGGVAVIQGASVTYRHHDLPHPYRQDGDFLYLTGLEEPGALCLLAPEHPQHRFVLFVQPRDPEAERWDGPRIGVEGAVSAYGADAAHPIDEFDAVLPEYLKGVSTLYYQMGHRESFDLKLLWFLRAHASGRDFRITRLIDVGCILGPMRRIKDEAEIELLRTAARITSQAHRSAMRVVQAGRFEYEIQAVLDSEFTRSGAAHAFDPIVAGGEAATVLHYTRNRARLQSGKLLLIDAGAEYRHYVSDLTRTVPVDGRFSPVQAAAYRAVQAAQEQALEQVRPGVALGELHEAALKGLIQGLIDLEVVRGDPAEIESSGEYKRFFMHRTSHLIGLDIRDPTDLKRDSLRLEPGMTLTVEPGLYFPPESEPPPALVGLGVRIEDSVLVTASGCEVLTADAPKKVSEIEALMSE